ncbi:MAG: hypothetical protein AMS26_18235 [Bacteroides sp. SM23_62]|nr:MAG: hypothetical protein AMS26_18235 [Bacteroides sp. SM23_62]
MNKEADSLPSIFNDVMGPVMRGPSSSHTAGSWRIARTTVQMLNEELTEALVEFDRKGVWASNYREQGTTMGMDGGLLGIDITDERIINPDIVASAKGISIKYEISSFETDHAITVRLTLTGKSGKKMQIIAVSTGGGMFEIRKYNGHPIRIRGDRHCLLIHASGNLEENELSTLIGSSCGSAIASHSVANAGSLYHVQSSEPLPRELIERMHSLKGVREIISVDPVLPILSGNETEFPFTDIASLLEYGKSKKYSLGRLGLIYERCRSGLDEKDLTAKMRELIKIIENGIDVGLKGTDYRDRILHQQSDLVQKAVKTGRIKTDPLVNGIIANVSALMESKSAMQVIVAVPTAGSCGTFGGTVKAFCDVHDISEEDKIKAYFAGGLIGVYFAKGPGFAAEEHGCQVETGASATMAAAALVELSGGTAEQAVGAASLALQNTIGLVCDPVGDRVEVPCLGKNIAAGMNALASSSMSIAGYDQVIPLDQVIATVKRVGRSMHSSLCNTGRGGLAVTPKAKELKVMLSKLGNGL